jgi:hypothetical protein
MPKSACLDIVLLGHTKLEIAAHPGLKRLVYAHIFVLQEWHAKEGCDKVIENYFEVNGVGNPGVTKA